MAEKLALVFSGGGAKGAFGAGVVGGLLKSLPTLRWDIVTGTSTGALIAPFAALARTDPNYAVQLGNFYVNAQKSDFVKSNLTAWRIIKSIWDLPEGLTSLKPLQKFVDKILSDTTMTTLDHSGVATVITAGSLQTGKLQLCTQQAFQSGIKKWYENYATGRWSQVPEVVSFSAFRSMMVASSSVPFASDPFQLPGDTQQLVDGGVLDKSPLRAAVAAGATAALVVMMSPPPQPDETKRFTNLFSVGFRAIALLEEELVRNDVQALEIASVANLAKMSFAGDSMPPAFAALEASPDLGPYLQSNAQVAVEILDPMAELGGTMDFDTKVPEGWPVVTKGQKAVRIMRARYDHGAAMVTQALKDPHGRLSRLLAPFAR